MEICCCKPPKIEGLLRLLMSKQAIELNCRITLNLFFLTRLLSIDFLQFNSLLFDAYVKFLSYGEYRIRI
ncbi:hypothetical protein QYF36_011778 [Acer negundo]|nr:hypothetical protein QYF36_011778 [Acer negundo]